VVAYSLPAHSRGLAFWLPIQNRLRQKSQRQRSTGLTSGSLEVDTTRDAQPFGTGLGRVWQCIYGHVSTPGKAGTDGSGDHALFSLGLGIHHLVFITNQS
jgi:hypothetical protein